MFNLLGEYIDQNEIRDTKIRLEAREKPIRGKPNNPSLIELDQNEKYLRPRLRPKFHQDTKSNPPPSLLQYLKSTFVKSAPIYPITENFNPTTRRPKCGMHSLHKSHPLHICEV